MPYTGMAQLYSVMAISFNVHFIFSHRFADFLFKIH
jgi:hypothetical protein